MVPRGEVDLRPEGRAKARSVGGPSSGQDRVTTLVCWNKPLSLLPSEGGGPSPQQLTLLEATEESWRGGSCLRTDSISPRGFPELLVDSKRGGNAKVSARLSETQMSLSGPKWELYFCIKTLAVTVSRTPLAWQLVGDLEAGGLCRGSDQGSKRTLCPLWVTLPLELVSQGHCPDVSPPSTGTLAQYSAYSAPRRGLSSLFCKMVHFRRAASGLLAPWHTVGAQSIC